MMTVEYLESLNQMGLASIYHANCATSCKECDLLIDHEYKGMKCGRSVAFFIQERRDEDLRAARRKGVNSENDNITHL